MTRSTRSSRRSPTSRPAGRWSSSTTRTGRTRATSSSPPSGDAGAGRASWSGTPPACICVPLPGDGLRPARRCRRWTTATRTARAPRSPSPSTRATGVTTGISAADRAHTIAAARRPGDHGRRPDPAGARLPAARPRRRRAAPARAHRGRRRPGRLAGLRPAGVLCEIVNDDGTMARLPELRVFAAEHGLALISIADLIAYRRRTEKQVDRVAEARHPDARTASSAPSATQSVARRRRARRAGRAATSATATDVLVRVHSECLTGDVFGSLRCDCGPQLDAALAAVAAEGRGVVLYVRGHEGRGIGLLHKLQAYQLQDARRGHRRRQPRTRPAGRRARLRHRRADPRRPRHPDDAAADQQPGQAGRARGLRPEDRRAGPAAGARDRRRTCATCAPSGTGWATTCPTSARSGRADRGSATRAERP